MTTTPEENVPREKTLNFEYDDDGYVSFSKEDALYQGMSEKEIKKAELTITITNNLIDDGVIKFNSSGEIIKDNRTPEIREQFNDVMKEFDESDGKKKDLFEKYFN